MTRSLSFHARLSCILAAFLLVVIATLYFSVRLVTESAVSNQAAERLESGLRVFERLLDMRGRQLRDGVQVLAADFGHGLFTERVISKVREGADFLAVNAQTNSANIGFNPHISRNGYRTP